MPNQAAPFETELEHERADSQPAKEPANEGEGNRSADRQYRRGVAQFLEEGRSEDAAAKAVRAIDGAEGEALRDAEEAGRRARRRR